MSGLLKQRRIQIANRVQVQSNKWIKNEDPSLEEESMNIRLSESKITCWALPLSRREARIDTRLTKRWNI